MGDRPELSRRQLEVLALYAGGDTVKQIGGKLFIEPVTVQNHLAQIRRAIDARNSVHAVIICFSRGYLCVDPRTSEVYIPRPLDDPI